MRKIVLAFFVAILFSCSAQKDVGTSMVKSDDTATKPAQLLNDFTFLLTDTTNDKTYGFKETNPIKVGGVSDGNGIINKKRYLNALLGPNGEATIYFRLGSCCHFKTPNGLIDNVGLLDIYKLTWRGATDTLTIYLNMYDNGDLKIPFGLSAKKM